MGNSSSEELQQNLKDPSELSKSVLLKWGYGLKIFLASKKYLGCNPPKMFSLCLELFPFTLNSGELRFF